MPGIGGGWWQGQGTVSCPLSTSETVQVCVQDLVTGGWQNYSCGSAGGWNGQTTARSNFYPYQYSNRYWRVWTWAAVSGGHSGYTWGAERYL
ncbi:MAG TPA: hypothetical protein VIK30_13880 [Polyangia bacterium]